jgi:type 1 glutamine amidotransferase
MNTKPLFALVLACLVTNPAAAQITLPTFESNRDIALTAAVNARNSKPLKVLLIAGGCCHDYAAQTAILKEGIEKRINADVTVVYNPDTKTTATFEIYESDDWAKGYDVILHDECCADVKDGPYVKRILAAHKNGVPAVNLHCAMHSYRSGDFRKPVEVNAANAGWYEMIGIQSTGHGPKIPIEVTYAETDHPIIKGMSAWTTIDEELYNNVRMFSGVQVLAAGKQIQPPNKKTLKQDPNAKSSEAKAVVVWTNIYGPNKTRIFSTSLGHFNDTVRDERYMELVVRGLLWTTENLTAEGKPVAAMAR